MTETLLFYLVIGLAVAVAVHVRNVRAATPSRFQTVSAVFFWPVYLPILLSSEVAHRPAEDDAKPPAEDDVAIAIRQVEDELSLALASLDGWAGQALAGEAVRIQNLKHVWRAQAARLRELDAVLAKLDAAPSRFDETSTNPRSEATQRDNLLRLRAIRRQGYEELMTTLTSVRGLATSIHVAKFTGAPLPRAEELVREIAAAVDGLAEVGAWCGTSDSESSPVLSSTVLLPTK